MSLEHELKRALRAQDPGDAFTARVLARVKADASGNAGANGRASGTASANAEPDESDDPSAARLVTFPPAAVRTTSPTPARMASATAPRTGSRRVWAAALAATLLLTAGGTQWVRYRQEVAEGERARAEVLTALRLTSAKLSIVRAAVADSTTAQ